MKQQLKVKYFSPEQAKYINPDLIDYVTLNDGSKIKMGNIQNCPQKACQNQCFCNRCGKVKYMGQVSGSPYVFRGGKKKAGETTVSGVGIEINPEGVEKDNLLTDILTGGDYNAGDDQNGNQGQIPQGQGQEQGYYDGDQQGTVPIQYNPVPEQYENPTIGYTDEYADPNQYYPGEQNPTTSLDDAIRYGPNNPQGQPQGVQEEYVNPDIPNENYPQQDYPQQPEEQIPVQTPYIPVNPVAEQPQPSQPYQQPSQPQSYPYQQPSQPPQQNQPYQQPMGQSFIPPQVVPASDTAKTNAPVKQANNTNNSTSAAPKSFKELFKEAKKQAKNMIKNVKNASNNIFRARRKEVQSNICPKCHLPKEILCPDCQRKDDESRLNSQRDTQKEDQKDNENPKNYKDNDNDNNNEKNDNSTPRRNNYQNDNRNPQRDDNRNNRRNNQGNDNNRRNPQRDDKNNNRRNNQGNDNNRRNPPQRDDNKNNRRNDYGSGNRRNNQGNDKDNNRRPDFGNSRRKSQDDNRKNNLRSLPFNGRRSDNKNYLRGNSDNKYNSRTFEKRNGEHDVDFDNYRYYATNNTTMENRRTITIVKRGDIVIANDEM